MRSTLTGILSPRNTGSHRCYEKHRALPLCPIISAAAPLFLKIATKNGDTRYGYLRIKIKLCYDFLRRHYPYQVKGSKLDYFFSACLTSSPVFILQKNKGNTLRMLPVKNLLYDFLRRHYPHQVKGSKLDYFFSARQTGSPVFILQFQFSTIITVCQPISCTYN